MGGRASKASRGTATCPRSHRRREDLLGRPWRPRTAERSPDAHLRKQRTVRCVEPGSTCLRIFSPGRQPCMHQEWRMSARPRPHASSVGAACALEGIGGIRKIHLSEGQIFAWRKLLGLAIKLSPRRTGSVTGKAPAAWGPWRNPILCDVTTLNLNQKECFREWT